METKVAVSGNSGRGAYMFVVAVVGMMLVISAIAGVIRLKETVFAVSQGRTESMEVAAKAATGDSIAAFYARPYRGEAQPAVSGSDVKAATDDSIAAFYARPYRGLAQTAASDSDVKAATDDSIAAFYARPYRDAAQPVASDSSVIGATDDSIAAFYAGRYYQAAVRQAAAVAAGR
jgi:hypothetical protein